MSKEHLLLGIVLIVVWLLIYYLLFLRNKKEDSYEIVHDDEFAKVLQELWLKGRK